jgi:hypothetical protein
VVGHAERLHGRGQLTHPVLAEAVLAVGGQVLELGHQHLALLTQGAGDERDQHALGRVAGHRGAGADGLVVGVRMDQQQPARAVQGRDVDALGGAVDGSRRLGQHRLLVGLDQPLARLGRGRQGGVGHGGTLGRSAPTGPARPLPGPDGLVWELMSMDTP